ncbi:FAM72 protein-domain-containing protein [Hyaloraphidium curvatum]|nr:FAM72 protein-domain-containing protein [Hyaloraphidium curvatum]
MHFNPNSPRRQQRPPAARDAGNPRQPASAAAQFKSKVVCDLSCSSCSLHICRRGMRAVLLGDHRVELYSTDLPPAQAVQVGGCYRTRSCECRVGDVACTRCGGVIGYHVTAPCSRCLEGSNNGHFWMFLPDAVRGTERLDASGRRFLVWSELGDAEEDEPAQAEIVCR